MRESPMRLAMVGTGNIARHHLRAFAERPDMMRLAAVCDLNPASAAAVAEAAGGKAVIHTTLEAMLSAGGVDGVIINSPHHLHFPMAMACVEAGLPVLIEKPLVNKLEELRKLREAAGDVLVVAGQMRRFEPEAIWTRQWITPETFGTLQSFDIQSWQNINAYISQVGRHHWLLDGALAGGGVVISLAIHQLDLVRFLSGCDYLEVTAAGRFDDPFRNGAESAASVLIRMDNGATGTLHATYGAARVPFCEAMTLFGDRGTVTQISDKIGDYRGAMRVSTEAGDKTEKFPDQWNGFGATRHEELGELHAFSFVNQLVHFVRAVRGEVAPQNDIATNFNTIAVIDAIGRAILSGRTEKVATS